MVHVDYEVVPVVIVVDEAGPVNVKLEHGLESTVYSLKVVTVTLDFDDIKPLLGHLLALGAIALLIETVRRGLVLIYRHIPLDRLNECAR